MIASWLVLAAAAPLQPSGKWVVDFAENACVLSRQYDNATPPFSVHFKAPILGPQFEIIIATPNQKEAPESWDTGWIEKPNGQRVEPINIDSYSTVSKSRLSRVYLAPDLYQVGEDGERLILHIDKKHSYDLALPQLKEAMAVLDFCLKDLRKVNGVDESVTSRIATPAKSKRGVVSYFSPQDYPAQEIREGGQGNVGALYWVETDGTVKECKVLDSSKRPRLDRQTCNILVRRGRFTPALDANGKPIRSPQYVRIRWRMPAFYVSARTAPPRRDSFGSPSPARLNRAPGNIRRWCAA